MGWTMGIQIFLTKRLDLLKTCPGQPESKQQSNLKCAGHLVYIQSNLICLKHVLVSGQPESSKGNLKCAGHTESLERSNLMCARHSESVLSNLSDSRCVLITQSLDKAT